MSVAKKRIVIADDEPVIRMDLKGALENLGYEVIGEAADGGPAVELTRDLKPDLVILDIKMKEMDGLTAARAISEERLAPVMLLSAYSNKEYVDTAREVGVMGYLIKPFTEGQLSSAIEVLLGRFEELRALESERDDAQEALLSRKIVERAKGVLMDTQGIKEAEAFRKIQRLSMNSRKSMREVAEAILLAHGVDQPA
ncbi:MAG: response regulator [Chloroflexota bacterium]